MKGTNKHPYRDTFWQESAHCIGKSMDIFFPPDSAQRKLVLGYYNQAKAICGGCPVSVECLDYGLKEPFGVWGGMTPRERYIHLLLDDPLTANGIRFDMRTESKREQTYIPEQVSTTQSTVHIRITQRM